VQAEVGATTDVLARRVHAEDTAGFFRMFGAAEEGFVHGSGMIPCSGDDQER
jgi:hypothetical protein